MSLSYLNASIPPSEAQNIAVNSLTLYGPTLVTQVPVSSNPTFTVAQLQANNVFVLTGTTTVVTLPAGTTNTTLQPLVGITFTFIDLTQVITAKTFSTQSNTSIIYRPSTNSSINPITVAPSTASSVAVSTFTVVLSGTTYTWLFLGANGGTVTA